MNLRTFGPLAAAFALTAPGISLANLAAYSQNFESLAQADGAALGNDGWKVFANVFAPPAYLYGYGPFPAPNGGSGFSSIASGQGGPAQGSQQLVVFNDYNNRAAQNAGNLVEALVFQEQTVGAADAGTIWKFTFDAKLGNLAAPTTAMAFVKTLDPATGYQTTGFEMIDTTQIASSWGTFSITFPVTVGAGQLLQFGFATTTTNDTPSGVFYDNISMAPVPEPSTYALMLGGLGLLGWASRRRLK